MEKRHKDILRALVGKLRHILVGMPGEQGVVPGNLDRELERLGIDRDGNVTPIDALADIHNGDGQAYRIAATQLLKLPELKRSAARQETIERAAYTWINRLLALRAMEVRGLIENTLRAEEVYGDISEKLYLLRMEEPERASDADGGWWTVLKNACQELASPLPGLFALDDPDAALHPTADALIQCIELVGGKQAILLGMRLEELDATFADPDAIGWAYQFYQEEAKAAIDAKCKSGGKAASRSELAAKTQLFTEPYMVQWLLQNSLGRSYHDAYAQSELPASWAYYIAPEQRGEQTAPQKVFFLEELTLLDPCMGSGHFLRASFDMFVDMYREQKPHMKAEEVANRILDQHLFGIDLDPRAAQLSALTLYLRAWELIKEERGLADMDIYLPPEMHLATTPINLDPGALERHLQRYPHDKVLKELLENIFTGLEHADVLGSLLRSREYLDQAITNLQKPHTIQMDETQEDADFRRTIIERARKDPQSVRQMLLDRIAASFHAESNSSDDVSMALFGREAERGVRLLQVLDNRYAVVATNPPYLGSKHMDEELKKYVTMHYKPGKRDLSATFILRCLQLSKSNGRVAMITQHNWMFLGSYEGIRHQLVTDYKLSTLAHLGTKTFKDLSNTNALGFVLFIVHCQPTMERDVITCFRLVHASSKESSLQEITTAFRTDNRADEQSSFKLATKIFQSIPGNTLFYWSPTGITRSFLASRTLSKFIEARQGLITGDNDRFLRCWWEINDSRWKPYSKGGPFRRWFGNQELVVDWSQEGIRIKNLKTPTGKQKSRPQNMPYYFREGGTWTAQSSYGFSVRYLPKGFIFAAKGPSFFTKSDNIRLEAIIALSNSKLIQFIFSAIQPTIDYGEGYFMNLPAPTVESLGNLLFVLGKSSIEIKRYRISEEIPTERSFGAKSGPNLSYHQLVMGENLGLDALIHTIEGLIDKIVFDLYELSKKDINTVSLEIGPPVAWYPLIADYDNLPDLPDDLDLQELPERLHDYLATCEHIVPDMQKMAHIKENLRVLYEAGPKEKRVELDERTENTENESEEIVAEEYRSIPTETFLEELSVRMQLHPISVYWLLEELQVTEMVRCLPEEKRLLEDRLSVLVLRLLGHRWPKQIEAFEPVPDWADEDGIIPLVAGTGHRTLAERVRERLYAEEGAVGAQKIETLLRELTGQDLEQWLRTTFFERHISQFKQRPIAWHLRSTPQRSSAESKKKRSEGGGSRKPAFECILYYHACTGDALARIRTQYVEPLLKNERGKIDTTALFTDDTSSSFAQERIRELEAFVAQLRTIEEQGFACQELREIVPEEVLDRWSGDGYEPPEDRAAFQRGEEAWRVDINDGVRVNIAPLQLAGVLAKEVLNGKDAKKALADRVRWRMDERRWVREGKLPRCGWMDERVPESPAWTQEQALREAGQKKTTQQAMLLDNGKLQGQEEAWS